MTDPAELIRPSFTLLSQSELAALLPAARAAREALVEAHRERDDLAVLALNECIVEALGAFLTELGEHQRQNESLWGVSVDEVNVDTLLNDRAAAWAEVLRLRERGVSTETLTTPYDRGGYADPISSRAWLNQMRRTVEWQQAPKWVERITRALSAP